MYFQCFRPSSICLILKKKRTRNEKSKGEDKIEWDWKRCGVGGICLWWIQTAKWYYIRNFPSVRFTKVSTKYRIPRRKRRMRMRMSIDSPSIVAHHFQNIEYELERTKVAKPSHSFYSTDFSTFSFSFLFLSISESLNCSTKTNNEKICWKISNFFIVFHCC